MSQAIREFVEQRILSSAEQQDDQEYILRLATAALLIEMSRQDEEVYRKEKEAAADALCNYFGLARQEVDELYQLVEGQIAVEDDSGYRFTTLLREGLGYKQKEAIIDLLWRVAAADGHVERCEEYMLWRIAKLIHLPRSTFLCVRRRVLEEEIPLNPDTDTFTEFHA